jgi:diguanylate cyclase (GGDEF)-like protein
MRKFSFVAGSSAFFALVLVNIFCSNLLAPRIIPVDAHITNTQSSHVWITEGWEFYPNELVTDKQKSSSYTRWNQSLDSHGYGTYVMDVTMSGPGSYSVFIPWIHTAYNLVIDGELAGNSGAVGTDEQTHEPAYRQQVSTFYDENGEFTLAIQVSNFSHYRGGLPNPVLVGKKEYVASRYKLLEVSSIFVIATMVLAAVYALMLYAKPIKEIRLIYIAALAMLLAVRTSLGATFSLYTILHWFPWELGLRIEYLIIPLSVFSFFGFFRHSYPHMFTAIKSRLIIGISLTAAVLALVLPMGLLEYYLQAVYVLLLIAVGVWLYVVMNQWIMSKEIQNKIIVIGTLAFSIGAFIDTVRYALGILIYFPLLFSSIGMMYLVFLLVYDYTNRFLESLQYNQQLARNLEKKVAERTEELELLNKKLHHMALRDNLTGLWNRNELENRKEAEYYRFTHHADPEGSQFTVFYIDIDNFKYYNDTFSHDIGDAVLKYFSQILILTSRRIDTVFRLGGDEFVIFLPKSDAQTVKQLAQNIIETTRRSDAEMQKLIQPDKIQLQHLRCSIGIAMYQEGDLDIDLLIQQADKSLYMAKEKGKDQYCMYGE